MRACIDHECKLAIVRARNRQCTMKIESEEWQPSVMDGVSASHPNPWERNPNMGYHVDFSMRSSLMACARVFVLTLPLAFSMLMGVLEGGRDDWRKWRSQ